MNRRKLGSEKEELACRYLEQRGYKILATNYWSRYAEIDIVAWDKGDKEGGQLVFIEVKYRRNKQYGGSLYAVSMKKMRNISLCARYYIYRERVAENVPIRFDVIAIDGEQITHVKNAFDADGCL